MTIPLHGHINPMLGLVKELAAKGHTIFVYSTLEFKKAIETAGGTFKSNNLFDYTERFSPDIGKDALKITELLLNVTEESIDEVIELLSKQKADLVLHDGFCLWAKVAARALDIPAVSVITTVVFTPALLSAFPAIAWDQLKHIFTHFGKTMALTKRYDNLLAKFAIKKTSIFDLFINQEKLNIVFTSRYFQPRGSQIGKEFMFIGPSLSGRSYLSEEKLDFKTEQPLVYVSLGTIFNNDPQFYHICIDALANKPYNVLISIGKAMDVKVFSGLPENIRVKSHVNQISVLEKAAVFVSHGGMNSVSESMYYGVPMVLFPAVQEQLINSSRVQQLGAGKVMQRIDLTKEDIERVVTKIVTNESFKRNALEVQKSLKDAVGVTVAANKIEEYVV